MNVIKRDGQIVSYNSDKIFNAILKAMNACHHFDKAVIENIIKQVDNLNREQISVEEIQDFIEQRLMESDFKDVAKEYIRYRYKREIIRENEKAYDNILNLIKLQNQDLKEENSNKDATLSSTQRDYMAGEVSKDLSERLLLPPEIVEAHNQGILHFHDLDYFAQNIHNCSLINLEDMLQNGTCINGVMIEKPHRFLTAMTIATQIITAVTSTQYGGTTISLTHVAPFVRDSFNYYLEKYRSRGFDEEVSKKYATEDVKKEIQDGVQTFNYQINSMTTTNGQSPFVSVFMYLNETSEYKDELALIIEEFLNQRILGMKNKKGVYVTQAFPKLLYVLEEDNIHDNSKYFYLTKLAAKCSAKRLVPDYISEKKMKELKEGNCFPCMGCVDGKEIITYKYKNILYVESFERMWQRISSNFEIHNSQNGVYINTKNLYIYDTVNGFVLVNRLIRNWSNNWYKIKTSGGRLLFCTNDHPIPTQRGRVLAENIVKGDIVSVNYKQYCCDNIEFNTDKAWLMGFILCDGNTKTSLISSIALTSENDIEQAYIKRIKEQFDLNTKVVIRNRGKKGNYKDLVSESSTKVCDYLNTWFEGSTKINKHIPNEVFSWSKKARLSFMAGMIDADGYINSKSLKVQIGSTNKELALQQMALAQTLDMPAYIYENHYNKNKPNSIRYRIEFTPTSELIDYIVSKKKQNHYELKTIQAKSVESETITDIIKINNYEDYSYDVTTESDHFEVSGLYSHNCRSFLNPYKDKNGNYKFYGRMNQGVVTINLVDVALSSHKDFNKFWKIFDERLDLCYRGLMCKHNRLLNTNSDISPIQWQYGAISRLKQHEKINELLFDGYSSISLGYAGLYECVKYMTDHSHTEPEGKDFAIKVMQKLNDSCDKWTKETNIGFSVYGTPIESTTYKFAKCLKKRFGIIEGITDRNYITNSYHVFVGEKIDAFSKLAAEAEFQALSKGGCISYIEVPNMQNNIPAIIDLLRYMYDTIMYAEINTKSDYCQVCGFDGEILIDDNMEWYCPNCGNKDQDKMNVTRRTCGYLGSHFWNKGRTQEIKERVLHL